MARGHQLVFCVSGQYRLASDNVHNSMVSFGSLGRDTAENHMESLDYWRICDELSVHQAALLLVGGDPSQETCVGYRTPPTFPVGYEAAKTAIGNALRRGAITGRFFPLQEHDAHGRLLGFALNSFDYENSTVEVDSLREWLMGRGLRTGFFFPEPVPSQGYLDRSNPRFAPKLAAAVCAWLATDGNSATSGKTPKQALTKWLREHASEFGLSDDEGVPNETGIEEAAKVANWQPAGGAPKTPAG